MMSNRDRRYVLIKMLYEQGKIQSLKDIFTYVPKSVVAKDLGKKVDRFTALINKVETFKIGEIIHIGRFCDLSESAIMDLALKELLIQKAQNKTGSNNNN